MSRIRHDLDFVVSAGLLASALVTGISGLISDLWDLNDFWYHTVAGYVMGAFGIVHVLLNRERLIGYARFRWRTLRGEARPAVPASRPAGRGGPDEIPAPAPRLGWLGRAAVSRRGLL